MRIVQDNEYKVYCRMCDTTSVVKLKNLKIGYVEDLDNNCKITWYKIKCTHCKKTIYINPDLIPKNKKMILKNIDEQKKANIEFVLRIISISLFAYGLYSFISLEN